VAGLRELAAVAVEVDERGEAGELWGPVRGLDDLGRDHGRIRSRRPRLSQVDGPELLERGVDRVEIVQVDAPFPEGPEHGLGRSGRARVAHEVEELALGLVDGRHDLSAEGLVEPSPLGGERTNARMTSGSGAASSGSSGNLSGARSRRTIRRRWGSIGTAAPHIRTEA
jgi:hypothetical protein